MLIVVDEVRCAVKLSIFIFCFPHTSPAGVKVLKADIGKGVMLSKGTAFPTSPPALVHRTPWMWPKPMCLQMSGAVSGQHCLLHVYSGGPRDSMELAAVL